MASTQHGEGLLPTPWAHRNSRMGMMGMGMMGGMGGGQMMGMHPYGMQMAGHGHGAGYGAAGGSGHSTAGCSSMSKVPPRWLHSFAPPPAQDARLRALGCPSHSAAASQPLRTLSGSMKCGAAVVYLCQHRSFHAFDHPGTSSSSG